MKKIIFLILLITTFIFTTGCNNNKLECSLTNDKCTLVFEAGKIIKYLYKFVNYKYFSKIDEFIIYFINDNNNTDAMSTIKALLASFGGNCNYFPPCKYTSNMTFIYPGYSK